MNVCMKAIHKHKKDWNKIFQLCGFATAAEYLKDKLAGKEVNSMISNPVTDLEEDEYEDIHAQESSRGELTVLGERAWTLLQQVFLANVKDAARTTIHEDVDALMVIESTLEEKGASMSADAAGALWHKEVATKYRLTNKRAYLALCGAFQVSCEFLIRRDGEMSEVKLKSAASAQTMASQAPSKNRSVDLLVQDFNQWFQSHHPHPGHLKAVPMPIYRIGTVATEKIKKGELYLGKSLALSVSSRLPILLAHRLQWVF